MSRSLFNARSAEPVLRLAPRRVTPRSAVRSLWLDAALEREGELATESLPQHADVCIVGGGFTGLWTALSVKRQQPSAVVVLIEADICGAGASGRNGGFIMTAWSKFASLRKVCGEAEALRFATAAEDAVAAIGAFCVDHGIDADFRQNGWLWTATNRAQLDAWEDAVEEVGRAGAAPYAAITPEEAARRSGSPVHLGGIFEAKAGTVQPASLARGLARVAREQGVIVCEHTGLLELEAATRSVLRTTRGTLTADRTVLAINAWAAEIPEVRRALVVIASDVIATDPIPERLADIGWEPGLSISDSRRLVNYYRLSSDGRIVFGKGGGALAPAGRIGASFHGRSPRAGQVRSQLQHIYPMLFDVPTPHSWRGPIDYSLNGLPFFAPLRRHPGVIVGAGFSGNGVGPSYVAGDILAALALGHDDHPGPQALGRQPTGYLPPEPLRYVGGVMVRSAVGRKEAAEDLDRRPAALTRALAALDPTSFVDRGGAAGAVDRPAVEAPAAAAAARESNGHRPDGIVPTTRETSASSG